MSDIEKASCELSRVLIDGGNFLIITADPNQKQVWMDRYNVKKFDGKAFIGKTINPNGTYSLDTLYFRSIDEIETHLKTAGLKISKTETIRSSVVIFGVKI